MGRKKYQLFIVTDDHLSPIIGLPTSENLRLIRRGVDSVNRINNIERSYPECFGEIGCLGHTYHIESKPGDMPVVTPPRKIPHSLKPKLKKELDRMEKMDIIEPVETPTDWANAMVIVEKPNGRYVFVLIPDRSTRLSNDIIIIYLPPKKFSRKCKGHKFSPSSMHHPCHPDIGRSP